MELKLSMVMIGDSLSTELIMSRSMLGFVSEQFGWLGFIIIGITTMGEGVMWTQMLGISIIN